MHTLKTSVLKAKLEFLVNLNFMIHVNTDFTAFKMTPLTIENLIDQKVELFKIGNAGDHVIDNLPATYFSSFFLRELKELMLLNTFPKIFHAIRKIENNARVCNDKFSEIMTTSENLPQDSIVALINNSDKELLVVSEDECKELLDSILCDE
jgi:hypothetical protein